MALAPRLDLRQTQSLVMTPQLQQAIKLLALSSLEIDAFIAEELERNPLLEIASGEGATMPKRQMQHANAQRRGYGQRPVAERWRFRHRRRSARSRFIRQRLRRDEAGEGGGGADGMLGMNGIATSGSDFGDGPDFRCLCRA